MSKIFRYTMATMAGLLAFIGLPLLAWGIGDVRGFFGHPARLLYCLAPVVAQVVAIVVLPLAGFCLVFRSWLGLLFAAAMAPVLAWRVHDEEALMRQSFGSEWETYRLRTWRIVPFLY